MLFLATLNAATEGVAFTDQQRRVLHENGRLAGRRSAAFAPIFGSGLALLLLATSSAQSQATDWGPWNAIPDGHENGIEISIRWSRGVAGVYGPSYHYRLRNRYTTPVIIKLEFTREGVPKYHTRVAKSGPFALGAGETKGGGSGSAQRITEIILTCIEPASVKFACAGTGVRLHPPVAREITFPGNQAPPPSPREERGRSIGEGERQLQQDGGRGQSHAQPSTSEGTLPGGPVPCGTGLGPEWRPWIHAAMERRVEFSFSRSAQACQTDPERLRLRITNHNDQPVRVAYTLRLISGTGRVATYSGALRIAPRQTLDRLDWRPFIGAVGGDDPREVRIASHTVSEAKVCAVHDIPENAGVGGAAYVPACQPPTPQGEPPDARQARRGLNERNPNPSSDLLSLSYLPPPLGLLSVLLLARLQASEQQGKPLAADAATPGGGGPPSPAARGGIPGDISRGLVAPLGGGWAARYCRFPSANTYFGPGNLARGTTQAEAIEHCEKTAGLRCGILRLPEGARPAC